MKFLITLLFITSLLSSDEYELGHGLEVNEYLHLGSYFSVDYASSEEKREFRLDDVAALAYGEISSNFSYLIELESAPAYVKNFTTNTTTNSKFHYERLYIDYVYSEMFNFRLGKQITPIGYWNLEPINVLRDTSSNPFVSSVMFPKLLTGLDIYGYLDDENRLKYHLFLQNNEDIDSSYINIDNDYFIGISLEYESSDEISFGGSLSEYKTDIGDKHVKVSQLDAKYDNYPFLFQVETVYDYIDDKLLNKKSDNIAGYAQGIYNFTPQHAIVSRYEYFNDDEKGIVNNIGIIGYNYRPVYSVSFKAEYQFNSDSYKSKSIISFSVLF